MTRFEVDHLVLVRHAEPMVQPNVSSSRWTLSEEGRAAARNLRTVLNVQQAYFAASEETKAVETVQELAGNVSVVVDTGFGEVRRPYVESGSDYRATARRYVEGTSPEGWEPREQVIARFDAAVARHAAHATAAGLPLVVGTHGMAPTIWLAEQVNLLPDPAGFWEALRFPDVIRVDLTAGTAATLLPS